MKQLSAEQIAEIQALYKNGATQVQLSKDYGVSRATIQNYIRGYYLRPPKPKSYGDMNEHEWYIAAKENYKKISQRTDALIANEHRWNIDG